MQDLPFLLEHSLAIYSGCQKTHDIATNQADEVALLVICLFVCLIAALRHTIHLDEGYDFSSVDHLNLVVLS